MNVLLGLILLPVLAIVVFVAWQLYNAARYRAGHPATEESSGAVRQEEAAAERRVDFVEDSGHAPDRPAE